MSTDIPASAPPRRSRALRRTLLIVALVLVVLVALAGGAALWVRGELRASLPDVEGEVALAGLATPVTVTRDGLGIPTVEGASRRDVALATGYLHGQERFFEMDLLRRQAAGELAELLGVQTLAIDRSVRLFQLRERARQALAASPPELRELLEAYAEGVNGGLGRLGARPFEYVLLNAQPRPWLAEDSMLTVYAMFITLQGTAPRAERGLGLMHDLLPAPLFDFLTPPGDSWDAPIDGEAYAVPAPPGPEVLDLRGLPKAAAWDGDPLTGERAAAQEVAGSNNWAVAGRLTANGGALVANDMHLALGAPNIWYRASLAWPDTAGGEDHPRHRVTGVTLPGTPVVVVGSNGRVAWGFTNTQADVSDVVLLDAAPGDSEGYLTPDGPRRPEVATEVIHVKGGGDENLEVRTTMWGPMLKEDRQGRRRALAWVALEPGGVGLDSAALETAATIEDALDAGNRGGLPAQNLLVAGADGRIAWSIAGRLPRRIGFSGQVPTSWADGSRRWDGLLPPAETPRVVDPESGRLWTANNRVVGGAMLAALGDGGYVTGARAGQIRDRLFALERATPRDLLAIQLDDRALFLARWRDLFLAALTPEALAADPRRREFRDLVESWGGRAAVDSVGYRLVRGARTFLADEVFAALTAPCKEVDPDFVYSEIFLRYEGPLWRLVTDRPLHLLSPAYASWDAQLLAAVDRTLDYYAGLGQPLREATWGRYNTVRIQHPLSRGVPGAGRWLDMPPVELPGDHNMPRVQTPGYGASERMAVSPGHEAEGIFHMPGGQSGHPLSPHYGDGEAAWESGEPTPFLPGEPVSTLRLVPGG